MLITNTVVVHELHTQVRQCIMLSKSTFDTTCISFLDNLCVHYPNDQFALFHMFYLNT